jgi:hypothetical protein
VAALAASAISSRSTKDWPASAARRKSRHQIQPAGPCGNKDLVYSGMGRQPLLNWATLMTGFIFAIGAAASQRLTSLLSSPAGKYRLSVIVTKNSLALLCYGFLQHGAGLTLLWIGTCHLFDLSPHPGQGLT